MSDTEFVTMKREFRYDDPETGRPRIIPRNWGGELAADIAAQARTAGCVLDLSGSTATGGVALPPEQASLALDVEQARGSAQTELETIKLGVEKARSDADAEIRAARDRVKAAEKKATDAEARLAQAEARLTEAEKRSADAEARAVEAEKSAIERIAAAEADTGASA